MEQHLTILKVGIPFHAAHLYEHIFCAALSGFFTSNGLFLRADYFLQGVTYKPGIVLISIVCVTERAKALLPEVPNVDISELSLNMALLQVSAETHVSISYDKPKLLTILANAHTQPWHSLEQYYSFDSYRKSFYTSAVKMKNAPKRAFKHLDCELILDPSFAKHRRDILPLFRSVAPFAVENVTQELDAGFGYYYLDEYEDYDNGKVKFGAELCRSRNGEDKLTSELETCKIYLTGMLSKEVRNRFTDTLKQYGPAKLGSVAKSVSSTYEWTSIIVGGKGWQEMATEKNIKKILEHTTLQLVSGREKQLLKLDELLKD